MLSKLMKWSTACWRNWTIAMLVSLACLAVLGWQWQLWYVSTVAAEIGYDMITDELVAAQQELTLLEGDWRVSCDTR